MAARGPAMTAGLAEDLATMEPERAAQQLLRNALRSDQLPGFAADEVDGGGAEFKSVGHRNLLLTNSQTVKFRQLYRKIPVYGSLVTVEMDNRNRLLSINSALGAPTGVDPVAQVSPAAALETVRTAAGLAAGEPLDAQPRLSYYFDADGRWRLVYIAEDVPKRGGGEGDDHHLPQVFDYVVDAHGGELVAALPRSQTIEPDEPGEPGDVAPPIFTEDEAPDGLAVARRFRCSNVAPLGRCLADPSLNVHTYDFAFRSVDSDLPQLPGSYVSLAAPDPWNPAAVSAHANASEVVDFSAEGAAAAGDRRPGGEARLQHQLRRQAGVREWRNAAWYRGQMLYGQRQVGGALRSYAVARDVVAHEIFHGVTESTARLDYLGESGALNESYSDIFGILDRQLRSARRDAWDWQIGEELDGTGLPLRDLSDPARRGQPAHMRDYQDLGEGVDHGGVHTNSGIHNKAAFNLLTADAEAAPRPSIRRRWRSSSISPSPSSSRAPRASATAGAGWRSWPAASCRVDPRP